MFMAEKWLMASGPFMQRTGKVNGSQCAILPMGDGFKAIVYLLHGLQDLQKGLLYMPNIAFIILISILITTGCSTMFMLVLRRHHLCRSMYRWRVVVELYHGNCITFMVK